jgi:pimeloyl-ACP methyl ester carboxylesterase
MRDIQRPLELQETTMTTAAQTADRAADQSAITALRGRQGVGAGDNPLVTVDYLEAGSFGPVVVLVHSSVSGARQWRRLMDDLKGDFRVRAVNLFGYGKTPSWPAARAQTLDDQARLVEAVLPTNADEIYLVGHSFGGSVAMKAAARLSGRVAKLVLLETNPFHLLAQSGRVDAFAEAMELRNFIKTFGALSEWATAAEKFADYWGAIGTWRDMSLDRRIAFSEALKSELFRMGCSDERNDAFGGVGRPAAAGHAVGMRSWDCPPHSRDRGAPASVKSRLDLSGSAGCRSHGPDHQSGTDQSPGRLISAIIGRR